MIAELPGEPAVNATDSWALPGVMVEIVGASGTTAAAGAADSTSAAASTESADNPLTTNLQMPTFP